MVEFRKLISFGKSSFVISVPKNWIGKNQLEKGDIVYIEEHGHNLIISSREKESSKPEKKISITTDGKEIGLLKAEIVSAYLGNCDLIEIKGQDLAKKATFMKDILQNLPGVELLEQSSTRILTKDILDIKEISIDSLIRRIDIITRSMLEDATTFPHEDFHESVYQRDVEVNRLVLLAKRVLRSAVLDNNIARSLGLDTFSLFQQWQLVTCLELAADEIKRVSRLFKELHVKEIEIKPFEKLNEMMKEAYLEVMKAYHTKDSNLAYTIELSSKKRMKLLQTIIKKNKNNSVIRLLYHMRCFNGIIRDVGRVIMN
ncbi:phosphate uptake regulator PhoU [Candidatus Woesearchaeota archaeon]|nr:phosphate uptake regulator PhoU [Candidatus Woesearchaeota archaeon]